MAEWTFTISAAFALYVLVGYPVLLGLRAMFSNKPVRKAPVLKRVTVVLPVRNGEEWIRSKLESILHLEYPLHLLQIVVISDGSADRTEEIVKEFAASQVELIRVAPGGKAAALNAGIEAARGEILFFTDVRQSLDPDSLSSLVGCFADPEVGAASGELVIREGDTRQEADIGLYWRYEKWLRRRHSRIDSILGATGCIYAMRRDLATRLPPDTLLDDVHLPLAAFFRGYRIVLDDRAKAYDSPTSLHTEFRRKVRTLAGVYQVIRAYPGLLGPSNRMWFHFVSHKVGRLLLPWAVLCAAVAGLWLPEPWRTLVLTCLGLFCGLAVADLALSEGLTLKRFTSPARTFVVLLAAALCAISVFFVPVERLWTNTRVNTAKPSS